MVPKSKACVENDGVTHGRAGRRGAGTSQQAHCHGLECRLGSAFYLVTSRSLRAWCLVGATAAQSPAQDRWSLNPQVVSSKGHLSSTGPVGSHEASSEESPSPLLSKRILDGSWAGDSPVGVSGRGAVRVEEGSSLCLPAFAPMPAPKQIQTGTTGSFQHVGQGGGNAGRGRRPAVRLALPTPLLLALLALHTLQWTGLSLTQIFRQQDLSISSPSSGGQILRPCGVLPFLLNPLAGPGQTRLPCCCVPGIWSSGLGGHIRSQEPQEQGPGMRSPTEELLNLSVPPSSGCQSDLWADAERTGWRKISSLRACSTPLLTGRQPATDSGERERASVPCDLGQVSFFSWPLLPLKWD